VSAERAGAPAIVFIGFIGAGKSTALAAARQAGLGEPEITRTLDSARKTRQPHPDRQAEEVN
jgi:dephospho-CoA kinase